jgi:methionine-rich copper-binding protein CopC
MLRFFANAFRAISVVALVVLAIALVPTVGKAFAHARATNGEAALNQPVAESCAAFEAWFLDPACGQVHVSQGHVNKAARMKHRLVHN